MQSQTRTNYDPDAWALQVVKDDLCMWVHNFETDIVVVEKPDGYDWWTIYDTTNECVEGVSLGPFDTLEDAIERLNEDLPGIEL